MPVRPPSLRSIAAFEAAARHGSFTRAADELNLTTGAISHAIKSLETRLDQALFDRTGRSVSLTPEGQSLAVRVRLSLSLLGDAFDVSPWLRRNTLVVSILPSIAEKLLLPSLGEFQRMMPDVMIDLRCNSRLADFDRDADIGVRFGPGGWSGLQSRRLANERLVPVASPSYRDGNLPRTVEELRTCNLILHPESSWKLWLDPVGADLDGFSSTLSIDDSALVIEAAAAGFGVALARARLVEADLTAGRLVRLFDRDAPAEYGYWAVWSGSSPKQALIQAFVDWAVQRFATD